MKKSLNLDLLEFHVREAAQELERTAVRIEVDNVRIIYAAFTRKYSTSTANGQFKGGEFWRRAEISPLNSRIRALSHYTKSLCHPGLFPLFIEVCETL